ncbi:MAG: asparagine synthase (glutamine-hydrolyzing) [Deltaproteobacteria bacterium RIFOXYA12_FULL_61_11]|nr:MAG: asparagine synthase (glutamine-hydrolyzing) [Deltaproteobacteria bacterium RIFOXYA12_FULL_61_11]
MCGIAGIFDGHGRSPGRELGAMLGTLVHRGPDHTGFHEEPHCALGTARLAIVDLFTGDQPLYDETGRFVLCCNGEIYNAPALRETLLAGGHRFRSRSDAEVIVHLFEDQGPSCLTSLRGMFALALWDRAQRRLFLARDRLGIKPLFYWQAGSRFAFASEIKALLTLPWVSADPEPKAVSLFLSQGYIPSGCCAFTDVQAVLPGHTLTVGEEGEISHACWWNLPLPGRSEPCSVQEATHELRKRLTVSVDEHLISDVPVGVFLSGGLDSSILTSLAARRHRKSMTCFSISFDEAGYDESAHARTVCGNIEVELRTLHFSKREFLAAYTALTPMLDEPFADKAIFPSYQLSRQCRESVKVVLSGEGADEVFLGYPTYLAHYLLAPALRLPASSRSFLAALGGSLPDPPGYMTPLYRIRRLLAGLSTTDELRRHLAWMGQGAGDLAPRLLLPGLTHSPSLGELGITAEELPSSLLRRVQLLDFRTYLAADLLVKADRASMACGLELRVPFLDHTLVEWLWSLPEDLILCKRILRRAFSAALPPSVLHRRKHGLSVPFGQWLHDPAFRQHFAPCFAPALLRRQGLFRPSVPQELLDQHLRKKANHQWPLLTYIMFQTWYRRWVEKT